MHCLIACLDVLAARLPCVGDYAKRWPWQPVFFPPSSKDAIESTAGHVRPTTRLTTSPSLHWAAKPLGKGSDMLTGP